MEDVTLFGGRATAQKRIRPLAWKTCRTVGTLCSSTTARWDYLHQHLYDFLVALRPKTDLLCSVLWFGACGLATLVFSCTVWTFWVAVRGFAPRGGFGLGGAAPSLSLVWVVALGQPTTQ